MKSVGFKLTAIMLAVIAVGILITVGVSVIIASGVITNESVSKAETHTSNEANRIDSWLVTQSTVVTTIANVMSQKQDEISSLSNVLLNDPNFDGDRALKPVFNSVVEQNDAFFETYMGFPNGKAQTGSGFVFDYDGGWVSYERGWYKLALQDTNKTHITMPYVDAQTNQWCISIARAISSGGEVLGVFGADIYVTELEKIVANTPMDGNGYAMLLSADGDILVHADPQFAPDMATENFLNISTIASGSYADIWNSIRGGNTTINADDSNGDSMYFSSSTISSSGWVLVNALPASVVNAPIVNLLLVIVPIVIVILAIAAIFLWFLIAKLITTPLGLLNGFLTKAASTGDLSLSTEERSALDKYASVKGEIIGQTIGNSVSFIDYVTDVSDELTKVAGGNLSSNIEVLSTKDRLGNSLKKMIDMLGSMFGEINSSSTQVSTGSRQISDASHALAQGATEQAATVEQLSNTTHVIAENTKANAEMAKAAAALADTIKDNAEKGSRHMDDMVDAVSKISQSSQSISKVIKVIDDIAFQTNILALNAAVEAARAGQHGKGFAVVAEEVRNLAAKSADAAKETGVLISDSIEKADDGSHIAEETAASLADIVSGIRESSQLISQIADSSEEQSAGIHEIDLGIEQMAQVVQQNSATAEESAAVSAELSNQSSMLESFVSQFKLKDSHTLSITSGSQHRK